MLKVKLGDIAHEVSESHKGDKINIPIVGLANLMPGEIKLKEWELNTDNTFSKTFKKGHILFGRRRAYLQKAAVAEFDGICSGDITVIEAKPKKILPELLPFIIQNERFFNFAVGKSAGSLSPRVKWEHLKDYEIILPDFVKQKELSDTLWAIINTIEAYKNLIDSSEKLLKIKVIEQLKYWNKRISPIPLGDLTKITTGKLNANAAKDNGKYPFFTCAKETLSIDTFSYDCECVLVAGNGDLNTKYYNGKFDAYQRTYIVESTDKSKLLVQYIFIFLTQYIDTLKEQAIGGVIKYIKMENLTDALIVVPQIEEQEQLITFANNIQKATTKLKISLDELRALYNKIILATFHKEED